MKGNKYNFIFTSLMTLSALSLGACAKQVEPDTVTERPVTTTTSETSTTAKRICTSVINNTTNSSLGGFFGKVVKNIEGPATFCLTLDTSGSTAEGTLRIEYEDDFGIRYYAINEGGTYFGTLKDEGEGSGYSLELVFADAAGFIQIVASENGTETMSGSIKYYNFPSYADALADQVNDIKTKCTDGTYTVAYCMGYASPQQTKWWLQPTVKSPQEQMLDAAKVILADETKTKTLGDIEFILTEVLTQ